jgi:ATP-dependent RNA helicase DDX54/DBP10
MSLSPAVVKGITKRGYKIPTPIQRKTIPVILEGRDVVAMAKTGSGKTASFLIPMFEKLKQRKLKSTGARALILSPTRELAIQTFKFIKEIGKFHDFQSILVLGGDSMDSQFSAIHQNPDIIVATPGRFLHICMEMDLKLSSIEYVVFDEADRLFEMGFGEQLNETIKRLPESRQTVMFSATLPKLLVDFAQAGLSDPVLIRLDVESKIPERLELKFVFSRPDERYASLQVLLKNKIPSTAQTVIFAGTQHHVELISNLLTKSNIPNTFVYSNLDPSARKINTAKFTTKKVNVLVVTDIAARGIDIPSLDYVINFHFPGKPKLFIHRVGRCARAGRSGIAYSIFSTDDEAHMLDLLLFLNRPLDINDQKTIGILPSEFIEEEQQVVQKNLKDSDIANLYRISNNAYKAYIQTRPAASVESNKKIKNVKFNNLKILDEFKESRRNDDAEHVKLELLNQMKVYKAKTTIFELNPKMNSKELQVMKSKRQTDEKKIELFHQKQETIENENQVIVRDEDEDYSNDEDQDEPAKKRRKKKKVKTFEPSALRDKEYYIPYQSGDKATEDGFAINSFTRDAQKAEFSVAGDNLESQRMNRTLQKWDRKKKKMVNVEDPRAGKIRTEHGVWIPASYKTDRYEKWKERTKVEENAEREIESDDDNDNFKQQMKRKDVHTHWGRHNAKVEKKKLIDHELKNKDQLMKQRVRKEKLKSREAASKMRNDQKRKRAMARKAGKAKKKN